MLRKFVLLSFALFLLAGTFMGGWIGSYLYTHPESKNVSASETHNLDAYKIYNLINDYRASKGLNKLVFDPAMCDFTKIRLTQFHVAHSHTGFMPEVWNYYKYNTVGENMAYGQVTEKQLVDEWIASPTHQENIVKPIFSRTCIATDTYSKSTFSAQEFASN